jgi:hypothetical protein
VGLQVTDVLVRLRPVELRDCEPDVLDFFSRDVSSVDRELSYDERAMSSDRPDAYDRTDLAVIRRGMGLNRTRKFVWRWLVNEAPTDLVSALPKDVHLRDISDTDYPEVRARIEAALTGFIGETGTYRGLAIATKMLHLKRPMLLPICDSYTVAMLGIPLKADASKADRVAAGLAACDITRQAVRDNAAELESVCAFLAERTYPCGSWMRCSGWRTAVRSVQGARGPAEPRADLEGLASRPRTQLADRRSGAAEAGRAARHLPPATPNGHQSSPVRGTSERNSGRFGARP